MPKYYLIDVTKGLQGLKFVCDQDVRYKIYVTTNYIEDALVVYSIEGARDLARTINKFVEPGHFIKILEVL